jgi:CelD/BcsL family acetyltransferase involved in cellulose biosynthesis
MREEQIQERESKVALHVEVESGLAASLDEAAEASDPRHRFLRRTWFEAAGGEDPATLTARRPDGRIVAALPTVRSGPAALRVRQVPGSYWPCRSFPIAADASEEEVVAFLAHPAVRRVMGRAWRLGPINSDDPTGARLAKLATAGGWTLLERRIATSFQLDIPALQAEAKWPRSSTLRKNRWFEKELAKEGQIEWRLVTNGQWSSDVFDALASIEAKSWLPAKTEGRDAKFLAPDHRRFWESVARDPELASMLRAIILTVGEVPAAFAFDLDIGSIKYGIATSYDQRFAKHSPGRLVLYHNMASAIERGIERVDWGAGDSGHKTTLGAEAGPEIVDLLFVRRAWLGALVRPLWKHTGR